VNIARFIANRIAFNQSRSFSRLIIRIAIAAMALSVAVMIISTSLVKGFQKEISRKMFGFWGHIQITKYDRNYSFENSPVSLNQPFYPGLDTMDGVRHIQPYATKPGIIKTGKQIEGIILKGVNRDYDWDFLENYLVKGKPLRLPRDNMSFDILVSATTARRLGLKLGQALFIHFVDTETYRTRSRKFRVRGIYNTGLEEYDKLFALVDLRQIQRLNRWDSTQVGGFEVFLDDVNRMDEINDKIYYMIGQDLNSMTIRQLQPNIFDWLDLQSTNERVILALMVIVAVFNMITALLILILERTKMIGLFKALGGSNGFIQRIFLHNATYIILAGLGIGNLLGLGLAWLQDHFGIVTLPEETYYVSVAPVYFDWVSILAINAGTFLVALLALRLPVMLANRISPVRALRFE